MNMCTVLTKLTKTISVIDVQKLKLCRVETLTRIFIKFRIVPLSSVTLQVLGGQSCTFVLWSKKPQEGSTPGASTDSGRSSFPR